MFKLLFIPVCLLFLLGDVALGQHEYPDIFISKVSPVRSEINEFGDRADYLEFTYTGSKELEIDKVKLFVTDDAERRPLKFELPAMTLTPGTVVRVWCDGENVYGDQIHSNFRLSKWGENIGVYYLIYDDPVFIDSWKYPSVSRDTGALLRNKDGYISPAVKD